MGNRVHVVKKQCEYGNTEAFNWKAEEFANFLEACNCSVSTVSDYDYSQFEVEVEEYKKTLAIVRHIAHGGMKEAQVKKYVEKKDIDFDDFKEALDSCDCTIEEMHRIMSSFFKERDKKSGYIQFHSW